MSNKPVIPSLGETSDEILQNALNYNTAGFILKFKVVGEGEFSVDTLTNKWIAIWWHGTVPLKIAKPDNFDSTILHWIKKGWAGIFVESTGRNPHYSKELHRARGIPLTS